MNLIGTRKMSRFTKVVYNISNSLVLAYYCGLIKLINTKDISYHSMID